MKKIFSIICLLVMIFVPSISFANIINKLNETGKFTKLNETLTKSGLNKNLEGDGPFTVFAPTNDAFNNLPDGTLSTLLQPENQETLQSILTYHVVSGQFMAEDVVQAINDNGGQFTVETLQGGELTLKLWEGNVYVKDTSGNKAQIIITDVETSNGVIHAINNVVLPE